MNHRSQCPAGRADVFSVDQACASCPSLLGVVIPLDGEFARKVSATRIAAEDPYSHVVPHITLLSGVSTPDLREAAQHIRDVVSGRGAISVRFSGTDTFLPISPVTYLRVTEGARELEELHEELHAGPLTAVPAFPFVPHLTLAQEVSSERLAEVRREWADVDFAMTAHKITVHVGDGRGPWTLIDEVSLTR